MNFIEVNGVSLRYIVEGVGKPIVLIHEMGGTLESWGLVAPLLASHRKVIRYDTRGAGFSEKIRGAAQDRHDDGRPAGAARCARREGESRAHRHRGRRRDRAAHRVPRAGSCRGRRGEQSGDLDPGGQPRRSARAHRKVRAGRNAQRRRRHGGEQLRAGAARRRGEVRGVARALARQRRVELRRRSTGCSPTRTSGRSCRTSNARCWCSAASTTSAARRPASSRSRRRSRARSSRCMPDRALRGVADAGAGGGRDRQVFGRARAS